MGYLKYAKPAILISFVVLFLLVIHPFTRSAVIVTEVESPASLMIRQGDFLKSIDGNSILTLADYETAISKIDPNDSVSIVVQRETFPYSYKEFTHMFVAEDEDSKTFLGLAAKETDFSRLKFSHKLVGGNQFVIESKQENAYEIISGRLKLNKVYDYSLKRDGNKIILDTVAGEEITPLIEMKGEFYAKIGNETFFTTNEIKTVCVSGVNCVLNLYAYRNTSKTEQSVIWKYGFETTITKEAGQRFIELTKDLSIASCELDTCLLNATIDYYLDGEMIGSEDIYAENKGLAYEKPIIGGAKLTKDDAMKALYFTQSMLKGELDAKIESFSPGEIHNSFFNFVVYVLIGIVIASAIVSAVLLKKIKIIFTAVLLGLSEIVIVIGSLTGLNFLISSATLIGLIAVAVTVFIYQNYTAYKIKKEGIIKSKIMAISKKMDNWLILSVIVAFVLVFVFPAFVAPILIHLTTILLLTKSLFLKAVETA